MHTKFKEKIPNGCMKKEKFLLDCICNVQRVQCDPGLIHSDIEYVLPEYNNLIRLPFSRTNIEIKKKFPAKINKFTY